jgi:hypothetical protein
MPLKPRWRPIGLWRITHCLERRTLEWWNDPRRWRTVLRARNGHLYDFLHTPAGFFICKLPDHLHSAPLGALDT